MPGKVVFVNRFFFPDESATSQMLSDLAIRLTQSGVDVHVICSRQRYENAAAELPRRDRVHGVQVHRVWTTKFGRSSMTGRALDYASFYLSATARLFMLLRRADVAVLKTDPPLLSVPGALAAALRGATLVNWLQDVFPEVASRLGMRAVPRPIEVGLQALRDRTLGFARANVVLGTRMREYLSRRNVDASRLHIIENWADGLAIQPKLTTQSALRAQLGLTNRFVVAYSGNLGRAHEFETMLTAAEELREDPSFVFLMIGSGAKMQALQKRVADIGLKSFQFLPYQPRETLADSMAAADVHWVSLAPELEGLVLPSKIYGILAAGRATVFVGDAEGDVAQTLRAGECGVSVQPGEGARLALELLRMKQDLAYTAELGRRARALFEARYTLESAASKWARLLSELGVQGHDVQRPAPYPAFQGNYSGM